jgi:hypothetical protein
VLTQDCCKTAPESPHVSHHVYMMLVAKQSGPVLEQSSLLTAIVEPQTC